jgi:ubiquinone biosynthesis protein COQ4
MLNYRFEEVSMMNTQFQPLRALRAARTLAANPDDLPQVFTIIEALSLNTLARTAKRMHRNVVGAQLMASKPNIVDRLADRDALASLPEGSLGRAYLAFVEREKISPEGIRSASDQGMKRERVLSPELDWLRAHLRDTHDLWHAATGYAGDVLGETSLLAFIFAQTWNPAIAFIISIGLAKTLADKRTGPMARSTIVDGFRRGLAASWLPAQDWDALLALPLPEVRKRLSLAAAPVYREIRSSQLKAAA